MTPTFRLLNPGEVIEEGDEFWWDEWLPVFPALIGKTADSDSNMMRRVLSQPDGFAAGLEAAAKIVEYQRSVFLSEEYATRQPMSSFNERMACTIIEAAIRAQIAAHKETTNDPA